MNTLTNFPISNDDQTELCILETSASMPTSCWGRYVNLAILEVVIGHRPMQIRNTRKQKIVHAEKKLHKGKGTPRSQFARELKALEQLAQKLSRGIPVKYYLKPEKTQ